MSRTAFLPTMAVGSVGSVMALPGSPSMTTPLVAGGGAVHHHYYYLPPPPPPPQPVSASARTDAAASPLL